MARVVYCDDEPDSIINFDPVYSDHDIGKNQTFVFDFVLIYRIYPASDQDSEAEEDLDAYCNLETRVVRQTYKFDRDWLIGGDEGQIEATVYQILEMIQVPSYMGIVIELTSEILELKKREAMCDDSPPKIERIRVEIDVMVPSFPGDEELAVAPASDEAMEKHLETVVVGDSEESYRCVICMGKLLRSSGVELGRMPCSHVFHRNCGEDWLRKSGICPICRVVLPS